MSILVIVGGAPLLFVTSLLKEAANIINWPMQQPLRIDRLNTEPPIFCGCSYSELTTIMVIAAIL